jgi:alkanesulfonate monooxygenase SsuD/methylene tetrahydromethanopterin reductase-like flavin-dependent oxidoreductase (luciferase family)
MAVLCCDEDNQRGRQTAAYAIKDFFGGPHRAYTRSIEALQQLVKDWNYVPDHLKAQFRYLDRSDAPVAADVAVDEFDPDRMAETGITIAGDPESVIAGIKLHEEVGVDQIIFLAQTAKMTHETVTTSIRLVGEQVIPHWRARQSEAETAAAQR